MGGEQLLEMLIDVRDRLARLETKIDGHAAKTADHSQRLATIEHVHSRAKGAAAGMALGASAGGGVIATALAKIFGGI
jgi:hypothetical protein